MILKVVVVILYLKGRCASVASVSGPQLEGPRSLLGSGLVTDNSTMRSAGSSYINFPSLLKGKYNSTERSVYAGWFTLCASFAEPFEL